MVKIVKKCIVKLESSNGKIFEVDELVASKSQVVKNIIEDVGIDHPMPLVKVSSNILSKVIEYCKYHVENQMGSIDKMSTSKDEIETWNAKFVKVNFAILIDLILVCLNIYISKYFI